MAVDPTKYLHAEHIYLCIDLKSFYASVECVERGLDPMTTHLVVADPERSSNTICLAITPAMKALGIRNRCRVKEIPPGIEYITAPPRMQHYINCSAEIYGIYLQYVSKEDIHVYSIDEAFLDVTHYLPLYQKTAKELAVEIMGAILEETGVRATCGIGTNLYLAKVALDITAKHSPDFIGFLTEENYRATLWRHQPLTDFWRIGHGTARRLAGYGITTMEQVAKAPEALLYRLFGIDGELLLDHAWGQEPTTIRDIKQYRSKSRCLSSGQVLMRDYNYEEGLLIVREMTDLLCLDLVDQKLVTDSMTLHIGFTYWLNRTPAHGTACVESCSSADVVWMPALTKLYHQIVRRDAKIRRVTLTANHVVPEESLCFQQASLFEDPGQQELETRNRKIQETVLQLKRRFGKNAVVRGMDLQAAATTRERNLQIGGHKSGEG